MGLFEKWMEIDSKLSRDPLQEARAAFRNAVGWIAFSAFILGLTVWAILASAGDGRPADGGAVGALVLFVMVGGLGAEFNLYKARMARRRLVAVPPTSSVAPS